MVERLLKESIRKVCEYDFGDKNDFMHEMMYMMEKSKFCRNVFSAALIRAYYENETILKHYLEKESVKPG